jgi:hypothetical protein
MSRDYKKESEWENEKYKRLVAKIDKNLAEEFLQKLDKPYAVWLKEKIEKYLEKNNSKHNV